MKREQEKQKFEYSIGEGLLKFQNEYCVHTISRWRGKTMEEKERKRGSRKKPQSFVRELFEWIKIFLVAGIAAFLLNNFVIANSTIPTGSMENTIMAGSRVFGSRLKYRFGEVKRNDIAIFLYGYKCRNDGQTYRETEEGVCPVCGREDKRNQPIYYVKRVIGMPGDHVEVKKTGEVDANYITKINVRSATGKIPVGTVYINGEAIEEKYLPEPMIVDGNQFPEIDVTVPEYCYFMMGDNRNNSADARFWGNNQFVKREKMLAKVYICYWPLERFGPVK